MAPQRVAVATAITGAWLSWLLTEGHHSHMALVAVEPRLWLAVDGYGYGTISHMAMERGCGWLWRILLTATRLWSVAAGRAVADCDGRRT